MLMSTADTEVCMSAGIIAVGHSVVYTSCSLTCSYSSNATSLLLGNMM